jgi:hypothetical protein
MLIVNPTLTSGADGGVLEVFEVRAEDAPCSKATLRTTAKASQAFEER